jgi:DNA-binding NarL/FixJ family response regulator
VISILIADDHPIIRASLRTLLSLEEDFNVVGEASDGGVVLEQLKEIEPDILLLDLKMPKLDGLSVLHILRESGNSTKVIVLTASDDRKEYIQAMKLGCAGIILKQTAPALIVKGIRKVIGGEIWPDSHTIAAGMRQSASLNDRAFQAPDVPRIRPRSTLSKREREIVNLVAKGFRNKEMAEKMLITEQTVKNHMHNIFDKLGVSDRLELALYAIYNGLDLGDVGL